jgi:hypothetical protein
MTATEVLERKEEFIRSIGPVFGRLEADYTGPLIERAFSILYRAGAFGVMPEILDGEAIKFEYSSPISRAHKMLEVAALSKTNQDIIPLAQTQPEIMDNFDHNKIARDVAEANGMPLDWLIAKEDVEKQRRQINLTSGAEQLGEEAVDPGVDIPGIIAKAQQQAQ